MAQEAHNGLTLLSFENPLPSSKTHVWDREWHIGVIRKYIIEGEPLEADALDDMYQNPEALSFQLHDLKGWVEAADKGEDGLWLEAGASWRLDFMKTVLAWAVEAGNGDTDYVADRTSGNGTNGLPVCTSTHLGAAAGAGPVY